MRFIDLFAGIGGFRLAFESVGGKCVFSSEIDKFAQKTYLENHKETPSGDITEIDAESIPEFDVLLAGFPCQPFSSIGLREGFSHTTQGTMFFEIERILLTKSPKAFVLENVEGLLTHENGNTFKIIHDSLTNMGYNVTYKVLNSAEFGVPQKRKRVYIVGHKEKTFEFPQLTRNDVYVGQFIETNVSGYDISRHLQNSYVFKKDDGHPEIVNRNSNIHVKTLVASYHKIQRLTGTFVSDGETGLRLLTKNECKSIMGFPKDFKFPVSRTQMYRQLGNSVAVPVVTEIAKKLKELFPEHPKDEVMKKLRGLTHEI